LRRADERGGIRCAIPPYGLDPVTVKETDHYKVMREFCDDPKGFIEAAIEE
jgi:predicted ATPase